MDAILRLPQVIQKTGLCRSSIYASIAKGNFPKQLKLTKRTSGWLESEVNDWIATLIANRDLVDLETKEFEEVGIAI